MDRPVPDFSIVVPAYNEAGNIRAIAARIAEVVGALGAFELIFVDDGSTDSTASEIKSLAARDKRVRFVRFARNFGHQAALRAGLRHSRGAATVLMDADFEHPPEVIPALAAAWREGARIVVTERTTAGNSLAKRVTSRWFYRVLDYIGDVRIEPGSADFLLMDRVVVDTINRLDDHDIFLRGLVRWLGYPLATVPYTQGTRISGKSKYTLRRMVGFAVSGIVAHSIKPLRIAIYLSLAFAMFGVLLLAYSLVSFFWISHTVAGWSSIMAVMAVLGAGQFLVLGIIGEYIGRILRSTRGWPVYVIAETETGPSEPAQAAVASFVRHSAGA
jgi:polyisoprenyl-phosphate glycosyltransferase